MPDYKILVYTVSRASTTAQVKRALTSLHKGRSLTGYLHTWLLWCNSPELWKATELGWDGERIAYNGGDNVGQHLALAHVLERARNEKYDFIVKVDDDLIWESKHWLRRLVNIEQAIYDHAKKWAVLSPRVLDLIHPIPAALRIKLNKIPLLVVPIAGGACRLHHISFFDNYVPDVRRALGAGGDTSIAEHATSTHIPIFLAYRLKVRHNTKQQMEEDPEYHKQHAIFQCIPYVPPYQDDNNG